MFVWLVIPHSTFEHVVYKHSRLRHAQTVICLGGKKHNVSGIYRLHFGSFNTFRGGLHSPTIITLTHSWRSDLFAICALYTRCILDKCELKQVE